MHTFILLNVSSSIQTLHTLKIMQINILLCVFVFFFSSPRKRSVYKMSSKNAIRGGGGSDFCPRPILLKMKKIMGGVRGTFFIIPILTLVLDHESQHRCTLIQYPFACSCCSSKF